MYNFSEFNYKNEYSSVGDLIEKVHLKPSPENKNTSTARGFRLDRPGENGNKDWYGIKAETKPSEVIQAIIKGHKPGLDLIEKVRGEIGEFIPHPPDIRRKKARGSQGDSLDIHSVLNGKLDRAWETMRTSPALFSGTSRSNHIKIVVQVGGNCNVSASQLAYGGAYASLLGDNFASSGYSVEVIAIDTVSGLCSEIELFYTETVIIGPGEPFDLELLANTISLPGFFRVLLFESMLTVPYRVTSGLGRYTSTIPKEYKDPYTIIIDCNLNHTKEQVESYEKKRGAFYNNPDNFK